jgi:two pore calcium channel protein 2
LTHLGLYARPYITKDEITDYNRKISLWGVVRAINMMLIFRLVNLAPNVKVMYAIISTSIDIIRSLRPIFGIMILHYYVYALLGIQLFSQKIQLNTFEKYNKR